MTKEMPRFARNVAGRDFAVGDIHGCFSHLERSLEVIGFDEGIDRLFSVGDLVDRGPESDQVLAWLDKPWFHAICGNHDFMAFRSALGMPSDVDYLQSWGDWLGRLSAAEQRRIGTGLAALPLAMEIETASGIVGLIHADCPFDDWRDMQNVRWDQIDLTGQIADCCLWSIERYSRRYVGPVRNVRAVVHGHRVLRTPEVLGNVHFIDTGGWNPGGYFTLLELETLRPVRGPKAPSETSNRRNR